MDEIEKSVYLAHLNQVRKEGYRPCIVAVLICNGKIGLCEAKDYHWYEFPQGGIEFEELPLETIQREIKEELGEDFYIKCEFPAELKHLFEVQHKMKVKDNLKLETGEIVKPIGKEYIVYTVKLNAVNFPQINTENGTDFKRCLWVNYDEAKNLIKNTKSPVKREIAQRAVNEIKKLALI